MFHVITGAIALYVIARLVPALPWPAAGKWLIVLALLLVSQHHLVNRTFFGSMASPEVPFAVLAVLGGLFGALLLLAGFLVLKDAGALLLFVLGKMAGVRLTPQIPAAC